MCLRGGSPVILGHGTSVQLLGHCWLESGVSGISTSSGPLFWMSIYFSQDDKAKPEFQGTVQGARCIGLKYFVQVTASKIKALSAPL